MMNIIFFFLWSTRSKLHRSIFVFFRIFLFRFETMTKNIIFFVTTVAFHVCFIHAKAIIVEFFIFFINIQIVYRCLNINKCVNVFRKIFVLFFRIENKAIIFFYHFDYCSLFFWLNSKSIRFALTIKLDFPIKLLSFFNNRFLTEFA